jgi:hypothetical protein
LRRTYFAAGDCGRRGEQNMSKRIAVVSGIAVVALLFGCDTEEKNAGLMIYNCLGFDNQATCSGGDGAAIEQFWLTGEQETKNLLQAGQVVPPGAIVDLPKKVLPGKYLWHVQYAAGASLATSYDSQVEVELFPGSNHIKLTEDVGIF